MEDNNVIMSDAYVYENQIGFVCHWVNRFDEEVEGILCETSLEMAEYLTEMRKKGFRVPESAIQALIYDAEPNT
jgi:hypothetical protein